MIPLISEALVYSVFLFESKSTFCFDRVSGLSYFFLLFLLICNFFRDFDKFLDVHEFLIDAILLLD